MKNKCAIYIMSCDATKDVAIHMLKSLECFFIDLPYDIFVGVNTDFSHLKSDVLKFIPLESKKSGWKNESIEQMNKMREIDPDITHVILILDDFVFDKMVKKEVFVKMVSQAMEHNIVYLSMKRSHEGLLKKVFSIFSSRVNGIDYPIFKIKREHLYYSSLQVALWDTKYLVNRIQKCDNIWQFEHFNKEDKTHYSVFKNILSYTHIVEKGEWDFGSKEYCEKNIMYFKPSQRAFRKVEPYSLKEKIISIAIFLFGYEFMKIKKYFK